MVVELGVSLEEVAKWRENHEERQGILSHDQEQGCLAYL